MTTSWTTLVSPEALAEALARPQLRVLDCRFSLAAPEAGEAAWRDGHVPGARYAHLDRDLSAPAAEAPRDSRRGRHPWPDDAAFAATLGRWGIAPQHQVVAYDDGDGAYAARCWWLFKSFGHSRVAVLDGGWAAWTAAALPVEGAAPVVPTTPAYPGVFDRSRLFDADAVQAHLQAGGLLVDARAAERFRGEVEPIDRKAGHVPGALNRPYAMNLSGGRFKPAAQLAAEFGDLLGAHSPRDVVAMCGSGVTACHHLLAMAHAGLPGAGLYAGSWSGWIADPDRPIATGA